MPTPTARTWLLVLTMATITAVSFKATGLSVDFASNPALLAFLGLLGGLNIVYTRLRPDERLSSIAEATAQILLILLFGALLTYAAAAANSPYRDAALQRLDQILGLDRVGYIRFFDAPAFHRLFDVVYLSLLPQFVLVPIILLLFRQSERMHRFMLATGCTLLATSAISAIVPALDAAIHVDGRLGGPSAFSIAVGDHVPTLEALRAGTLGTILLHDLKGVVTFPSFHTAGGLLLAWAVMTVPYVRWAGLALNAILIAATPVVGEHYIVDLIGGAGVAAAALALSAWITRRSPVEADVRTVARREPQALFNSAAPLSPPSIL